MYPKDDIVLIPFPFTDLSGQKVRPALVLACLKGDNDCIVAFITSIRPKKTYSHFIHLSMEHRKETGLKTESWIRVDKIATLTTASIMGRIGTLNHSYRKKVDSSLRKLLKI